MGDGYCSGIVTEDYTNWNDSAYEDSANFFGLDDYNYQECFKVASDKLNSHGRVFGSDDILRFEVDMEAKTLKVWRDGTLIAEMTGLPGGKRFYVASTLWQEGATTTLVSVNACMYVCM